LRALRQNGFTHVDPFEDTESWRDAGAQAPGIHVSPTSIRSRILKEPLVATIAVGNPRFTHVDPFEDTESKHKADNVIAEAKFHPRRSVRGY